jgi:hypothetical protein
VAAVSYGIDNEKLLVWIDSAPALDPARAGSLCRRHADALSVPKGWSIDDRRQPVPMLFSARDITPAEGLTSDSEKNVGNSGKTSRKSQAKVSEPSDDASLFDEDISPSVSVTAASDSGVARIGGVSQVEDQVEDQIEDHEQVQDQVVDEPELEETRAIPWTPRLVATDGNDDTASIPKGRLLGRAFGERQPRRDAQ